MQQIIQSLKDGKTSLQEIPAPIVRKGHVVIRTTRSLVSLGTERMLVEFGKSSLISKARQQPDKVKQVLEKIQSEGLIPTLEAVFNKLEQPLPLGYCNVGVVIEVGEGVQGIKIGDRVASNGPHAEIVCVPQNLVAVIPQEVSDDEAAFTVIGSIGLQGIRLCNPTLGETIVVVGLGLIGLITAELLVANGCRVIGIDFDDRKLSLAQSKGVLTLNPRQDKVEEAVLQLTSGVGADGVIITASAKGDEIITQAARMSRKRGRIILVGVIGLNLSRADFYEKELTFQVSCSYGPGRYDENYEGRGIDYPLGFVRWTEKRNFETILETIRAGKLNVASLITEKVPFYEFNRIYENISNGGAIASLLEYPEAINRSSKVEINTTGFSGDGDYIGVIGAGNFAKMSMLPALERAKAKIGYIASASGVTGSALAKKHKIAISTTDYTDMLHDERVKAVMITTRHNQHAKQVIEALQAGKHVFVEKPLAINLDELNQIKAVYQEQSKSLTVGFNRRFSPHALAIKKALGNDPGPMNIVATMNAGFIPESVWIHDMQVGGGRIIGEACHLIDLISFFAGSRVKEVCMSAMGQQPGATTDNATLILKYENGTNATVHYFANGSKAYAKERVEIYSQNRTLILHNFIETTAFGVKGLKRLKTRLDKGHKEQFNRFVQHLQNGGEALIPFESILNTSETAIAAVESLKEGRWIQIGS
jgi:predicted dehydrogenase/threonine dehydrogenase-like Zn-dependent dehydrogenase